MKEKARQHGIHILSTIFEVARAGFYYDTAMLISPEGQIVGKYRKVHPAAYLSLDQQIWLRQAQNISDRAQAEVVRAGAEGFVDAVPARPGSRVGKGDVLITLTNPSLATEEQVLLARLRELDQMKSDFVAITSHELRTPLAGVRGFIDMLRRRGQEISTPERDEYLDIVLVQTDRLIALVDDLLVVSKIEAGMLTLEPETIDLGAFLARLVRTFGDDADRVRVERAEGAPERMVVDQRRLTQILTNLIHNALNAMPSGGELTITTDRRQKYGRNWIAVTLADTGLGILPENMERIFEPFFTTRSGEGGTGLGLSVTYGIVASHGGRIEVESAPGEGASFIVWLPVEARAA